MPTLVELYLYFRIFYFILDTVFPDTSNDASAPPVINATDVALKHYVTHVDVGNVVSDTIDESIVDVDESIVYVYVEENIVDDFESTVEMYLSYIRDNVSEYFLLFL